MTSASDTIAPVIEAIRDGEPKRAQDRLEAVAEGLPARQRTVLQARIHMAADQPDRAVAILEALPNRPAGATAQLARAYLLCGDAAKALAVTGSCTNDSSASPPSLQIAKLRLEAAAALGNRHEAVEIVTRVLDLHGDDPRIRRLSVRALVANDAVDEASKLIRVMDEADALSDATLVDFTARALKAGRSAAIVASLPAMARLSGSGLKTLLRRAWERIEPAKDRSDAIEALGDVAIGAASPMILDISCKLLSADGHVQAAIDLARRFRSRASSANAAISEDFDNSADTGPDIPNGRCLMDWLGVPMSERQNWERAVQRGARASIGLRARLIADPNAWNDLVDGLQPADLEPLQALNASGNAGIVATTHVGELMGTLAHFKRSDIAVSIIGGNPVLSELLDGGERLLPLGRNETPRETARNLLGHIRDDRLVGLSTDGRHGSRLHLVEDRGVEFALPDSIPQLAHRHNIPVVWIATYWSDGKLECDCRPAPGVLPGETFLAYRERWFRFSLDAIRAICQADPANAYSIAERIRGCE